MVLDSSRSVEEAAHRSTRGPRWHDRLEDERWWALVFGIVSVAVAVLVSVFDIDADLIPWLLVASIPAVVGYWLRYLWPIPAWTLLIGAGIAYCAALAVDDSAEGHAFLVLVAAFYTFFREPNRRRAVLVFVVVFPLPVLATAIEVLDSDGWLYWTMGIATCAWFGTVAHHLRSLALELAHRRDDGSRRAVAEERRRIAGDVHDLVGHSLSVVMLHLTATRRMVNPEDPAHEALKQAEGVGRQAMSEIRRTIGLLHDADHPGSPVLGLDDIHSLVAQYREAGLRVELALRGDPVLADPATSVAAYRIVQEALVNVTKHSVDAEVIVEVTDDDGRWTLLVTSTSDDTATAPGPHGQGMGLVGMAERARSVGGTLVAGPTANGWRVEASLPSSSAPAVR